MARLSCGTTLVGSAALLFALNAYCAEGPATPAGADAQGAERCIQISRIDRTEVVDDQNIKFFMIGGKAYNNHLPNRCIGLKAANAFKFATSLSQLCNLDIISVLSQSTGELVPGASCGLGAFEPFEPKKKSQAN